MSKNTKEAEILEEKIKKFKRSRKKDKEHIQNKTDATIDSILSQEDHNYNDDAQKKLESVWNAASEQSLLQEKNQLINSNGPLIIRQTINEDIYLNENVLCNYEDLQLNTYIQSYFNIKSSFQIDFLGNNMEKSDFDDVLQQYIARNGTSVLKMHSDNLWDDFKKFYNNHNLQVIQTHENLQQKCQRLCPKASTIHLTRLSTDVLTSYLGNAAEDNNNTCKLSSVRKDSGFFDMSDTIDNGSEFVEDLGNETLNSVVFNSGIVLSKASTPKVFRNPTLKFR